MSPRLDHICIDAAERICPFWASCYGDEDLAPWLKPSGSMMAYHVCVAVAFEVGKVKNLAKTAHPRLLGRQVLLRYASFVTARWLHQLERKG